MCTGGREVTEVTWGFAAMTAGTIEGMFQLAFQRPCGWQWGPYWEEAAQSRETFPVTQERGKEGWPWVVTVGLERRPQGTWR